jgi:hypothetical protein
MRTLKRNHWRMTTWRVEDDELSESILCPSPPFAAFFSVALCDLVDEGKELANVVSESVPFFMPFAAFSVSVALCDLANEGKDLANEVWESVLFSMSVFSAFSNSVALFAAHGLA